MVRGASTRCGSAAGVFAVTAALALGLTPGVAAAAPKPATKPNIIQITGNGITGKLTVQHSQGGRLFDSLLSEVNWMSSAQPQMTAQSGDKLGPKYVVTVLADKKSLQVYELFPMAAGGPRAHRPAKQPTGRKADGWFYGRLTMPETLRVSGVPLKAKPDVVAGGIGGGIGQTIDTEASESTDVREYVGQVRQLFLLNGAVLVAILVGLAGIAFMIRRRV